MKHWSNLSCYAFPGSFSTLAEVYGRGCFVGLSCSLWIKFGNLWSSLIRIRHWSNVSFHASTWSCSTLLQINLTWQGSMAGLTLWAFPVHFLIKFGNLIFRDQHWSASRIDPMCPVMHLPALFNPPTNKLIAWQTLTHMAISSTLNLTHYSRRHKISWCGEQFESSTLLTRNPFLYLTPDPTWPW